MPTADLDEDSDFSDWETNDIDVEAEVLNIGHVISRHSGQADIQVFYEGEENGGDATSGCNKDHSKYIPFNGFRMNHLPKQYQQKKIYIMIQLMGDMTVKLRVLKTSPERAEFYQDTQTPYPFHNKGNFRLTRTGTGHVFDVLKCSEDRSNNGCPCKKCLSKSPPDGNRGEINIITSTHVIFDNLEAKSTKCEFSFWGQDKKVVVDEFMLKESDVKTDRCFLKCVTCDMELVDSLIEKVQLYEDISERVSDRYMKLNDRPKFTCIVSHPHGGPKKVSIGDWTKRERKEECYNDEDGDAEQKRKNMYTVYCYNTSTCPRSSGAPVINFGKKTPFFNHIHCGSGQDGNISSAAVESRNKTTDEEADAIMEALGYPSTTEKAVDAVIADLTRLLNT